MTQVHRASLMNMDKINPDLSDTAEYSYDCILKYKKLKTKEFSEQEALEFTGAKRSTLYRWLNKFNKKSGSINIKTAELNNKFCRPHNFKKSKIINQLIY